MAEKTFDLDQDCELRFKIKSNESAKLILVRGRAEIFGTELVISKVYHFPAGSKVAVYSWFGCCVKLKGNTIATYVTRDTPMPMYLNAHSCLEKLRVDTEESYSENKPIRGPITLIAGPSDVGKSTLCKILLNYAVKEGRKPIFVELDVGQGELSIPGTLGAFLMEKPSSVEEGYCFTNPVVYSLGSKTPEDNVKLYINLISKIAAHIHDKILASRKVTASGVIINTCGWIRDSGYKSLLDIAQAFEVDVIFVMEEEKLYNDFVRDVPPFVRVTYLPKSGGVEPRSRHVRLQYREHRLYKYFYGGRVKYHPYKVVVPFSDIQIYKAGSSSSSSLDSGKFVSVNISPKLKNLLLAVSLATKPEEALLTNVAGFVCVLDVDEEQKTVKILSPQPGPLPGPIFVLTDIAFTNAS